MVIVRLWGGLGNQLFQYAYGYSVAKRSNTELRLDCRFYTDVFLQKNPRFTKQKMRLTDFPSINLCGEIPPEIRSTVDFLQRKNINRLLRLPAHARIKMPLGFTYVKEGRMQYDHRYVQTQGNVYFDGYWQCERYFSDFREELLPRLTPFCDEQRLSVLLQELKSENSVAVHIRRGDYVNGQSCYGNLYLVPKTYYLDCIERVTEELPAPRFYFFSNDIEWAKKTFGQRDDFVYVSGTDGLTTMDEFCLMSRCKHQIVGNSTFSWWAAWLNTYTDKKIWAPARWFGNRDIWPNEWIKVPIENN